MHQVLLSHSGSEHSLLIVGHKSNLGELYTTIKNCTRTGLVISNYTLEIPKLPPWRICCPFPPPLYEPLGHYWVISPINLSCTSSRGWSLSNVYLQHCWELLPSAFWVPSLIMSTIYQSSCLTRKLLTSFRPQKNHTILCIITRSVRHTTVKVHFFFVRNRSITDNVPQKHNWSSSLTD